MPHLILGGIYKTSFSEKLCRIIGYDELEVYYDAYWPGLDKWSFGSNLKRRSTYYRITPKLFLQDSQLLKVQPLSVEEQNVFMPGLPLRLCRYKELNWTEFPIPSFDAYKEHVEKNIGGFPVEIVLPVPSVSLRPYGKEGRITALKSTVVAAKSSLGFSGIELLWLSHNLQAPYLKKPDCKGVGLFRSGHEKNVPAYYIGGYKDAAGFIED